MLKQSHPTNREPRLASFYAASESRIECLLSGYTDLQAVDIRHLAVTHPFTLVVIHLDFHGDRIGLDCFHNYWLSDVGCEVVLEQIQMTDVHGPPFILLGATVTLTVIVDLNHPDMTEVYERHIIAWIHLKFGLFIQGLIFVGFRIVG